VKNLDETTREVLFELHEVMGVRATGLFEEVFLTVDNDSTVV
jgi:hypothetical protein